MHLLDVGRVVVTLAVLVYAPGWALAAALGMRDTFARVWCGLAMTSIVALLLALAGMFSLPALLAGVAVLAVIAALVARRRAGATAPHAAPAAAAIAWIAAAAAFAWCWPPYETVIAASDSTMYLNAGIHLAETGRLDVPDTAVALLPPDVARHAFPSVALSGVGPFIRLPGGLLMRHLDDSSAAPAFFPLPSVWAGIFAAGSTHAAAVVAPVFAALGTAALVLFAGEALGTAAAACAAPLLVANFALWWFGRFATSETLALAFVWAGFVFLGRAMRDRNAGDAATAAPDHGAAPANGAAIAAGLSFGLAGVSRTETLLFRAAAGALWWVWTRRRVPTVPLLVGVAVTASLSVATSILLPTHHIAFVVNDALLTLARAAPRLAALRADPGAALAWVVPVALVLIGGVVGRWHDVGFAIGALRVLVPLVAVVAVVLYARIGGQLYPARHVGWLATYCSWPLIAVAVAGFGVAWRRGGGALRLALVVAALVALGFLLDPRVAPFQPWAIRRFLPVVIPTLVLGAAAALGLAASSPWRALRLASVAATVALAILEVRPVLAARRQPYFDGGFAAAQRLADAVDPNGFAVMDAEFADFQLQVPLWLMHGRETVMLHDGNPAWREGLKALIGSGRPVYWIARAGSLLPSRDLVFTPTGDRLEIEIPLPDARENATPRQLINRVVRLQVYRVTDS